MANPSKEIILTRDAFKKYQQKLDYYKTHHRKEVAERIKQAKEFGEIGENSEYEDAKSEQAFIEGEIMHLENILRNAKVLDEKEIPKDRVSLGSTVTLKNLGTGKNVEYTIVGSLESDPSKGFISNESPVGHSLIGAEKGKKIEVEVPKGKMEYEVVRIYQKQHLDTEVI
ncbi:MAG: transcription elongation factor GreA [Candidatus Eremiobacteraeota bacterium]|nr:transcription elongation factor GreA [Candidatus Eremiobacteraeota bacterium]